MTYNWKRQTNGICGLINMGNTCYMNSIFQVLLHHDDFVNYFISNEDEIHLNNEKSQKIIVKEFNRLVKGYWSFDDFHQIKPLSIIKALFDENHIFHPFRQNDAQEFLTFLLDSLHIGLEHPVKIKQKNKKPSDMLRKAHEEWKLYFSEKYSHIISLYFFQIKTTMKCPNNHISTSFSPSSMISLNIHGNCLTDCLNKHFLEEITDYKCETCSDSCSKKETLQYDSKYLFIQLKRFQYSENKTIKICDKINYSTLLNLNPYIDVSIQNQGLFNYELDGIILHIGSANNGHYYAYQKHNNEWFNFDDNIIVKKSIDDVINDQNAYLLIYKKIN